MRRAGRRHNRASVRRLGDELDCSTRGRDLRPRPLLAAARLHVGHRTRLALWRQSRTSPPIWRGRMVCGVAASGGSDLGILCRCLEEPACIAVSAARWVRLSCGAFACRRLRNLAPGGSQVTAIAVAVIEAVTFPERSGRSVGRMAGAQPAAGQAPASAEVTARRLRLATIVLGALVLVLAGLSCRSASRPASGVPPVIAWTTRASGR
jgi:hypothetical protein